MRLVSLLTAFTLLLALPGCAYLREAIGLGAQKPKVTLTDIQVAKVSMASLDLAVTVRVDNPNDFVLSFYKLRYKMVASGLEVANGIYDDEITVPAEAHALIKLPLKIDAQSAMKLVHDLLSKPDDIYAVLTATADFKTPFGLMAVNFEDKRPLKKLAGF